MGSVKESEAAPLYGGAIAVVSGTYSVYQSTMGMGRAMATATGMLAIGVVVLLHGLLLFTDARRRLGDLNGALMVVWGLSMLGLQALNYSMNPAMLDGGMVALASLMVMSGAIMSREEMTEETAGM